MIKTLIGHLLCKVNVRFTYIKNSSNISIHRVNTYMPNLHAIFDSIQLKKNTKKQDIIKKTRFRYRSVFITDFFVLRFYMNHRDC